MDGFNFEFADELLREPRVQRELAKVLALRIQLLQRALTEELTRNMGCEEDASFAHTLAQAHGPTRKLGRNEFGELVWLRRSNSNRSIEIRVLGEN